jgi:hypothetical protein
MARGIVMTDEQVKAQKDVIVANVRLAFMSGNTYYHSSNVVKCLGGYKVTTPAAKKEAARFAREELGASIVNVGNDEVAFVKRRDL